MDARVKYLLPKPRGDFNDLPIYYDLFYDCIEKYKKIQKSLDILFYFAYNCVPFLVTRNVIWCWCSSVGRAADL